MSPPERSPRILARALALPLALAFAAIACRSEPKPVPAASVVFILIDTLRADHLGAYGYTRPTSPTIDRLASEGLLFRQARSAAPWTNPSVASIFSGRRPSAVFPPGRHDRTIRSALPAELPLLAEKLNAAGLYTAAIVDHPGMTRELGFGRGFEDFVRLYQTAGTAAWSDASSAVVGREFAAALDRAGQRRFFLYLHLIYPHAPYAPPAPYDRLFGPTTGRIAEAARAEVVNAYDGEIRFTDAVVASLVAELERRGLLETSWLVLTADHGEGFWEHGRSAHGNSFFDELLHVPLLVRPPRRAGVAARQVAAAVSLVDLHATVLEAAAADRLPEGEWRARSLLRLRDPAADGISGAVVSEHPHSGDVRGASLLLGGWKLIRRKEVRGPELRLYDLGTDPGERSNLAELRPELVDRLDRELRGYLAEDARTLAGWKSRSAVEPDAEELARLRALGYLP